jgi:glutamyl-tRNA synthetase
MNITHAIRGEEWLPSTPKHLQLYKYLGWQPPLFAHLPLLLNADKSKLSKRQGDVAVEDYIKKGYLAEAVVNFMAFMGWNPGTEKEIFSLAELVKEFRIEKISKSGAVFNIEKLDWFNKQHMSKMDLTELANRSKSFFTNEGLDAESTISNFKLDVSEADWLEKVVALEKERATTLVELVENVRFIFAERLEYEAELLIWKKSDKEKTIQNLTKLRQFIENLPTDSWQNRGELESKVMEWIKENNLGNGNVLWPMRVALSGQTNSPGPFEIVDVLGKEETIKRINSAIIKL